MEFPPAKLYEELTGIAAVLSGEDGKGILSADETLPEFGIMFRAILVDNNEEMRRQYRQILLTTPGLQNYISGILMSPEGLSQRTNQGIPFPLFLRFRGIMPGVSVDQGLKNIKSVKDELVTMGLDELSSRCQQYRKDGCSFTNWKCVLRVNRESPTPLAINENANLLARYASIVQSQRLVPMVEMAILTEYSSHPLERTQKVLEKCLASLFKALQDYKVILEGIILRVNMVMPGEDSKAAYTPDQIAESTLTVLQRTVPPAVAGIAFTSGNMLTDQATVNLDTINSIGGRKPWPLTFSFNRPLQAGVLFTWLGREDWVPYSQEILLKLAYASSSASHGIYLNETIQKIKSDKFLTEQVSDNF